MRHTPFLTPLLILLLIVTGSQTVFGKSPFVDPGIPDGETTTYTSHTGDRTMTVVEVVTVKHDGLREVYEITSRSDSLDRTLILDKETMAILSVHTIRKFSEVTLDSKLKVLNEKPSAEEGEVKLADFAVITYLFRGFPFTQREKLKIGFYGEERKRKFTFSARYKKKDHVTLQQKTIECHKLEFGLDGFWGAFLPKMYAWYSVDPPHYLVRYQGLVGPPGSPKRDAELLTYSISADQPK
jgi:hypothetical protein